MLIELQEGRLMNELEREELRSRISAMDIEEMRITAQMLPACILWQEIQSRYNRMSAKISVIEKTLGGTERI